MEGTVLGDLTGKTARITGAGSGIGRGIARALAVQGAQVTITDVNPELAARVKGEFGGDALDLELDVTDPTSVAAAIDTVLDPVGGPRHSGKQRRRSRRSPTKDSR